MVHGGSAKSSAHTPANCSQKVKGGQLLKPGGSRKNKHAGRHQPQNLHGWRNPGEERVGDVKQQQLGARVRRENGALALSSKISSFALDSLEPHARFAGISQTCKPNTPGSKLKQARHKRIWGARTQNAQVPRVWAGAWLPQIAAIAAVAGCSCTCAVTTTLRPPLAAPAAPRRRLRRCGHAAPRCRRLTAGPRRSRCRGAAGCACASRCPTAASLPAAARPSSPGRGWPVG